MAPSVCQNSPKLLPHKTDATNMAKTNKTTTTTNAGAAVTVAVGSTNASVTMKSQSGCSSHNGSMASYKMTISENSWTQTAFNKENQRPPTYNPEDYAQTLKKFSKKQNSRSIYDAIDTPTITKNGNSNTTADDNYKSSTLPNKHSEYKSPIQAPPESDSEMSLRQFASVTDLLTKLRADLRVSFPSFVQEFVTMPSDGISLLLEVLRAIQLSQASNATLPAAQMTASMPRNAQMYQRRALLDELACLQCLSICCTRSLDAMARLGSTPVGLMPLASSATGQGIRARILAMQLMCMACDKNTLGPGAQKTISAGHTAVSEAMSTLRLRCSEPVRFRLLVGMLNSGGGSGELQAVGLKFINTFLESSENLQQRLYLQAELHQAGLEPSTLAKTISSSSPWLEPLRHEIKRYHELYVDVDKMLTQARDADRVRSQMVILERRVQILHEEKAVLTSMERRLQERCAELQREIFRLQGAQHDSSFKSIDDLKQPVALPRHVPPKDSSAADEHEDEGISSSETGPSLSPVPILVLPSENANNKTATKKQKTHKNNKTKDAIDAAAIKDAMAELDNIVSEAEKQISCTSLSAAVERQHGKTAAQEKEIVPVNIVPQPPRKSRSLAHLVSPPDGSDLDGSEYGMFLLQNAADAAAAVVERQNPLQTFFDESDYNALEPLKNYKMEEQHIPEASANTLAYNASTTRELLDVIMNARHNDDDPTIKALREAANEQSKRNSFASIETAKKHAAPAQHFNGVFFMTGMNTPQKYPKPDVTAALQARRVTKNVERLEAVFANTSNLQTNEANKSRTNQQIYFGSNPTLRINTSYSSFTNNVTVINNAKTRTRSYTQGSKVTDLPSGLY